MAPTPGTLPFYPPYQPGSLPFTGQELLYLVNSQNATAAASYRVLVTDVVGKAPSVLPQVSPSPNDRIAIYQVSSNLPQSVSLGQLPILSGNVATGGVAGQVYSKNSATNFDASWTTTLPFLTLGTLTVNGIATVSGLSVGVTGTIASLAFTSGTGTNLSLTNLTTTNATVTTLTATNLTAANGSITSLTVTSLTVGANATVAGALSIGTPLSVPSGGLGTGTLGTVAVLIGGVNNTAPVSTVPATTAGLVLTSNGSTSAPSWFGSMVLLNTLSPNGVASVTDVTSLSSTYRDYMIMLENVCPANNTTVLQLTVATSGGVFISGGYVAQANVVTNSVQALDTSTTAILLSGLRATTSVATATTAGVSGTLWLQNPASATILKQFNGNLSYQGTNVAGAIGTTNYARVELSGTLSTTLNPITGLAFAFSSGNIATGTIKIWGLV